MFAETFSSEGGRLVSKEVSCLARFIATERQDTRLLLLSRLHLLPSTRDLSLCLSFSEPLVAFTRFHLGLLSVGLVDLLLGWSHVNWLGRRRKRGFRHRRRRLGCFRGGG